MADFPEHRVLRVVTPDGAKGWWKNGVRHRLDGPAYIKNSFFGLCVEWWIDGENYSKDEFIYYHTPKVKIPEGSYTEEELKTFTEKLQLSL
jgi:hypothetical protein